MKKEYNCPNKVFKRKFCKKHYFDDIKIDLQLTMKNMYKTPEFAFCDIDFSGKGFVTEEEFFNTLLIYKLKYSKEEIKEYFDRENAFKRKVKADAMGMNFEIFKRHFFPSEALRYENPMKRMVKACDDSLKLKGNETNEQISEILVQKLKNLEVILKKKFEK